ncbi:MAG TPA: hypothetical protein VHM69_03715 [Rubrobacter sp.]|nr:hypothetical protein [Rubrobacter sp.]
MIRPARGRASTPLHVVAALSLLAAMIHLWVIPEHFEVWWGYGTFFLVSAIAQGLYAPGMLLWPNRVILLAGVAGNLVIVILWLVTRTSGIPLFGPHAGESEDVGTLDLVCTLAEVGIIAGLGALTLRDLPTERRIQIVVVLAVSALFFWHLLHLLAGSSAH